MLFIMDSMVSHGNCVCTVTIPNAHDPCHGVSAPQGTHTADTRDEIGFHSFFDDDAMISFTGLVARSRGPWRTRRFLETLTKGL
jgi:hypothetical protein